MTDLLARPIRGVAPSPTTPRQPLVLTSVVASVVTALGGIIVFVALAVIGWFSADVGSFAGAVRIGVTGWLFGNGGGLVVAGTSITMLPLGLLLVFGALLHRAGRWTARRLDLTELRDAAVAIATLALAYAAVALVAYVLTRSAPGHALAWRTLLVPLLLAAVAAGSGVLRSRGLDGVPTAAVPLEARAALTGGLGTLAGIVAASALVFSASTTVHLSNGVTLAEGLHAGVFGGIVLALLGLAFVPNAILCAGAYVAGPGFSVGSGTTVTPGRVDLGPLPAHPLLAALPSSAGSWWQSGLLVVPVIAGAVGGVVALRRYPVIGLERAALRGGLAGFAGGTAFGLLTGLACGAIGPGRMQDVGPAVLPTLGLCAVSALLGGAVAATAYRWLDKTPAGDGDSLS